MTAILQDKRIVPSANKLALNERQQIPLAVLDNDLDQDNEGNPTNELCSLLQ